VDVSFVRSVLRALNCCRERLEKVSRAGKDVE
jgi:hypothetical protein